MRPECRGVSSGSYVSFWCALGVVEFLRVCLVCPGVPWWSLGSFGFVWFARVRPGCPSGLFGPSECAFVMAGFVQVRLVRLCAL